jgi:ABC transporter related
MMTLTDYISGITQAITFFNYHNMGLTIPGMNDPIMITEGNLELIAGMIAQGGQYTFKDAVVLLTSVLNASAGDIWWNAGMMILSATGMIAVQAIISIMSASISSSLATNVRSKLNKHIQELSLAEINKFSTASLVTRATNDIQQVQFALLLTNRMFFAAPVTAIWAIVKINLASYKLMIPTIVGILLLITIMVLVLMIVLPKFKKMQVLVDKLNSVTRENLSGIRVVHAYNAEQYQEKKFEKANTEMTKTQLFTGRAMVLMSPAITLIMNGISIAIYWIGAVLINDPMENLGYPDLLSFMMLSTQIVMSFMMLLMMFYMLPRASVAANRILDVINTKSSLADPEVEKPLVEQGSVVFDHVSFCYPDSTDAVLEDISFEVKKGETIAFIGATGSGKTTIAHLVDRLYDATSGAIYVDGVNVKDIKQKTLHSLIGYVPQKGLLFRGDVSSNVALGNPNATKEEIIEACKVAEADDFVQKMDGQYEAHIAQGGSNVSGGQRQRLCIARAVCNHPEIYVFDDSFSALDFKTDKKVRENLKEYAKDATKLIVAQRIGTVMDADHIVVLSDGKMVGYGTHKELLQDCDVYREIALSQLSKEELGL